MLKISSYNKDKLQLQADLKKYETNEYLIRDSNTSNNSNYSLQFSYIKNKFFYGETLQKASLLNTWSNLFSTISDIYADYVSCPVRSLNESIHKLTKDFVVLWFATCVLERINWELKLTYVPAKWHFIEDWVHRIARFYQNDDWLDSLYYILVQSFYDWYIENKLYRTASFDMLDFSNNVPLDSINETSNLQDVVQTWLDWSALYVIKEDDREQSPVSIFQKIQHLVLAIDRNIVMFNTEFLKNTESYTIFKNIQFPASLYEEYNEWKKINMAKVWKYVMGSEDSSIEFVNNENKLIEKAIAYEETMIRRVSWATSIPQEFLWLEQKNGAIGKGSRLLSHWSFIKKIERIRWIFDKTFREIQELVIQENGELDYYYRPDVFAKTDFDLLEEIKQKVELWLITKRKAIMSLEWLDEKQADEMLEDIKEEKDENIILQPNANTNEVIQEREQEEVR